jgi:hypothetical protein
VQPPGDAARPRRILRARVVDQQEVVQLVLEPVLPEAARGEQEGCSYRISKTDEDMTIKE